jgi:tyrosyl-tRNA synthetase
LERDLSKQYQVLKRGTIEIIPENQLIQKLEQSIKNSRPLRVKAGFDPTAPDLHLGHTVLLEKLRQFQDYGHTVIFLIGDFTGMVGDPTGVNATRPMLTKEEVLKNAETYRTQIFKILKKEQTEIRFNSEWLGKLTSYDLVRLCGIETVARMLERDDFSKRFKEERPIYIHEFIYPLLQGYDSVALDADIEVGGTDQKFNLLMGRAVQEFYHKEPQVIMTLPLLVGTDGVMKMSKSAGNYVGINEEPENIYGKIMSISDKLMWNYYELLSRRSIDEIKKLKEDTKSGKINPKTAKEQLAFEITARFHGEEKAKLAEEHFRRVFGKKELPEEVPVVKLTSRHEGNELIAILVQNKLAQSRSEAKRLIKQGAVEVNGKKIDSEFFRIESSGTYNIKVGKRRFLKVIAETG